MRSGRYRRERQKINRKRDFYPPNSIACVVLFFYLQTNTEANKKKKWKETLTAKRAKRNKHFIILVRFYFLFVVNSCNRTSKNEKTNFLYIFVYFSSISVSLNLSHLARCHSLSPPPQVLSFPPLYYINIYIS